MKHVASFCVVFMLCFFLAACNNRSSHKISGDLVTNPKSATVNSGDEAIITFEKTEHDFGKLLQGEVVTCSFHFTNTGKAPLIISRVTTSCGCTVGEYPKEPIAPGDKGVIKATYDSKGHHGFQSRTLTVATNTNPATNTLRIKATVQTPDQF